MMGQLDAISEAIGELRTDVRNLRAEVTGLKAEVASFSKDRWTARGIIIAISSGFTVMVMKGPAILAALVK